MSVEHFLLRCWYQPRAPLWPLSPLEWLWRGVAGWRRRQQRRAPIDGVPVIVVGNITVGGTGKTPVVIALVEHLQQLGFRPGIVSRGYGGAQAAEPRLVKTDTPADLAGDEATLMARRTGLPVAVCRRRRLAAQRLIEEFQCDVIVSDDGLQHYDLPRMLEMVLIDGRRGLGNGHCLPVGPLRETPERLRTVDHVLVNGNDDGTELPVAVASSRFDVVPVKFVNLADQREIPVTQWQSTGPVHALAGIGNPDRFFTSLRDLGIEFSPHAYPDHHLFSAADVHFADAEAVIMTEKDAVKCGDFATSKHWYLQIGCQLPESLLLAVAAVAEGANT